MNKTNLLRERFEPFSYKTLKELRDKINELNLEIPISNDIKVLRQPVKFNKTFIPNRLSIQPMEGFDAKSDGAPGNLTIRRYNRYAQSGAGLIWFESTTILENCRTNPHQLVLSEHSAKEFQELVTFTREKCNSTLKALGFKDECVLILQLNHAGRYCKREGKRYPIRAYHNHELDNAIGASDADGMVISDDELEELEDNWTSKVGLAKEVGFDGVDIKSCHGYLINELFCSRTRQNSKYGGNSIDNRTRFFFNVIKKSNNLISKNSNFFITTRIGVYDGIPFPNGFGIEQSESKSFPAPIHLTEPVNLINKLYALGIRLINVTAGNPYYKPQITRPFDTPIEGNSPPSEHPLYGVHRIVNLAATIKKHLPKDMVVIGSGYSYLRQFAGYIAAGLVHQNKVDICGFGRMALANPSFPKQIFHDGVVDKKEVCIACSKCSGLMRAGKSTGCVIRDPQYQ